MSIVFTDIAVPSFEGSTVVVPAPGPGAGNWAGAASAVLVDGTFWMTYRVRRPLREGRGVAVVVARSQDGERFETVTEINRESVGAESFERPVLIPRPSGGWRLYLSCATPGSKHWWIEAVDADLPHLLPHGRRHMVLTGDGTLAVKDPVILHDVEGWHMWVCCHPLSEPGQEDRMSTWYATSIDGIAWSMRGEVLRGRRGAWDARGTRVTAVIGTDPLTVLYDGRPTAEHNWFETTGIATEVDGVLVATGDSPVAMSPHSDHALRYVAAVPLPDGRVRFYFEAARPDGAHDLRTSVTTI
jgi:hypothetical protein